MLAATPRMQWSGGSFFRASLLLLACSPSVMAQPGALDRRVLTAEAGRIAVIEKVRPTVVAIFAHGGQGGGSGVVISKDGFALTNFHVVQGSGSVMQCGLADGILYDSVLVGVDKVGDVALIKLVPKKAGDEFKAAALGDSDKVRAGDWSLAMGNPFLLATDFTPTVTFGLVSGVHRYQYPESAKGFLEYTDCIQVDTSINPGNSGGPLFNMDGELIGINGRISLEKRGRVNSGVGYAISINQIKNFMGHLRAGLDTDHATLGAFIENKSEEGQSGMVVTKMLEDCDAHRRGLDLNDELVSFAGRQVANRNQYQNVLGLYPKGWRVPMVFRRENNKQEILVRLMGVQRGEIDDGKPRPVQPGPQPKPPPVPDSPASKFFEAKPGFANYYFNKLERDRLWTAFQKHGNFEKAKGAWTADGDLEMNKKVGLAQAVIGQEKTIRNEKRILTRLNLGGVQFEVDLLKPGQDPRDLKDPPNSGGLLVALYQYHRLLTHGVSGFEQQFSHGGHEPFYPPASSGAAIGFTDRRVDTEVLLTEHAAISAKWYFSLKDQTLLGAEVYVVKDEDPCELYFADYKKVDGKLLPHRIDIGYGNGQFGTLKIRSYQIPQVR